MPSVAVLIGLVALAVPAQAATGTISPSPFQLILDSNGNPVNAGCIWTYTAGTSTPVATYTDVGLAVANANPIIASSAGRFTAFLTPGQSYKFVYENIPCTSISHGTVLVTADNIAATPTASNNVDVTGTAGEAITAGQCVYLSDGSGSKTQGQWYKCDSANTYSATLPTAGIAPSAISAVSVGTIRITGSVTGLSSLSVGADYFAGSAGAITSTAPANRRLLGRADSATSLVLVSNPPPFTGLASGTASNTTFLRGDQTWATGWTVISTTSTGAQNDFAPGLVGNTVLRCNNATVLTISGFTGGYDGQRLLLVSVGAGQVDLVPQATSTAANRLLNYVTAGSTSLAAGSGTAEYVYDATTARWRLVSHEQGAWITRTFSAGNFTASAGTWTVGSGDITTDAYMLRGRTVTWMFDYELTTTSAGFGTDMRSAIPGGFTPTKQVTATTRITDNATTDVGKAIIPAAGTFMILRTRAETAWQSSITDLDVAAGEIQFEAN